VSNQDRFNLQLLSVSVFNAVLLFLGLGIKSPLLLNLGMGLIVLQFVWMVYVGVTGRVPVVNRVDEIERAEMRQKKD